MIPLHFSPLPPIQARIDYAQCILDFMDEAHYYTPAREQDTNWHYDIRVIAGRICEKQKVNEKPQFTDAGSPDNGNQSYWRRMSP